MEEVKGKTTDQDKMITEAALVPILKQMRMQSLEKPLNYPKRLRKKKRRREQKRSRKKVPPIKFNQKISRLQELSKEQVHPEMQTDLISVQVLKSLLLIMLEAMQEVALLMTSTILILETWQGAKQIRKMTTSISISVAMAKVKAMRNKKKKSQLLAQVISWTFQEELT